MTWLITPGQPVPVDPVFNNVSLLLHGNGTNGSTTITDNSPSPKTVTAVGNAQISTAQSKFGGSSLAFDGNGDYLTIPHDADLSFGAGNFTVELWFYANSLTAQPILFLHRPAVAAVGILWAVNTNGSILVLAGDSNNVDWELNVTSAAGIVTTGQWHHIALTRNESTWRGWLNGSAVLTPSATSFILNDRAGTIFIGRSDAAFVNFIDGYIDDFRITKGVARYTANFTPPTAPFPDI